MTAVVTVNFHTAKAVPLVAGCVAAPIIARQLLSWRAQIACIVCIIIFIPIKRYALPVTLPISLGHIVSSSGLSSCAGSVPR